MGARTKYRRWLGQLGLCRAREHVVHDNQPQFVTPLSCRRMHSVFREQHRTNIFRTDLRDPPTRVCVPQFIDAVNTAPNRDMRDAGRERLPMHLDVGGAIHGADRNR